MTLMILGHLAHRARVNIAATHIVWIMLMLVGAGHC